jgi:hypothetical protein
MERRTFLGAVAGTAAVAGLIPSTSHAETLQTMSNRNIAYMMKVVQATVDDLNQDASDYGGYRVKAIQNLQDAHTNLGLALANVGT